MHMSEVVEIESESKSIESVEVVLADTHSNVVPATALVLGALALAGCGGGGGDSPPPVAVTPTPTPTPTPAPAPAPTPTPTPTPTPSPVPAALDPADMAAARFLLQAQFSASDAEIAAVRQKGYATWLNEQFDLPMSQKAWDWFVSRGYTAIDSTDHYYIETDTGPYVIQKQIWDAPDAVRKRCALAFSELFVVSYYGVNNDYWPAARIVHFWDLLNTNAFGNFRKLLEDVTLSSAMGMFLNTRRNEKENPATGRQPDENYAREVMQLFTIGLYELNLDGTLKRDSLGNPIETYTASDVTNLARVFTGYDDDHSPGYVSLGDLSIYKADVVRLPMRFDPTRHSMLAATFLGTTIPANTDGTVALKMALDTLFNHPNVGPFIGRQMIQRLVTSNPSPAYVARVAAVFSNNGSGVRGDLRAMFAAILLDDEARNAANLTSTTFGKLREPMIRLAQWGRTFRINSLLGSWKYSLGSMYNPNSHLSQYPFYAPSVFNFFRPGYVPPSTALASSGATAPEFQLVNESSVSSYINFMRQHSFGELETKQPDIASNSGAGPYVKDLVTDYSAEIAIALDPLVLVRRLNLLLCAGQMSSATEKLISDALTTWTLTATSSERDKRIRVSQAILFVMVSSEYLIQK
jgi:uncharacterized protein (DUF1800 family)